MNSALFSTFLLLLLTFGAFGQPAAIVMIRHAEKPEDPADRGLSALGRKRAESLTSFLATNAVTKSVGRPVALYATALAKGGRGQRCQQTLQPLSLALGLTVETPFKAEENAELAKRLLTDPEVRGKPVLICWTHERLPELMKALGVDPVPPKLRENEYDAVYVLKRGDLGWDCRIVRQDFQP